jgi:hypothetical protein
MREMRGTGYTALEDYLNGLAVMRIAPA